MTKKILREVNLYKPMKQYFQNLGYKVYPEVFVYRNLDALAVKESIIIAIEMKMTFTKRVFSQILIGTLFADYSYVVVGTNPRQEKIDNAIKFGIGILSIKKGVAKEILQPKINNKYNNETHRETINLLKHSNSFGVGGKPQLLGQGVAQYVWKRIVKYRENHPEATWKELYANIPNHYCSYHSMQNAMKMLAIRLGNKPISLFPSKKPTYQTINRPKIIKPTQTVCVVSEEKGQVLLKL